MASNVEYLTEPLEAFEAEYSAIREKEGRWLEDVVVKRLPYVDHGHPHFKEWKKRNWMLLRFLRHLHGHSFSNVLDIGCGNGWMTHHVKHYSDHVTGVDVGGEELEQAARCFPEEDLQFTCCSDWSLLPQHSFDLIYFAGSFHYFEWTDERWEQLYRLLAPGGEIHILETHFYSKEELAAAKQRSRDYFGKLGFEGRFYQHLSLDMLPEKAEVLHRPSWRNKLFKNRSPFPWVCIKP